MTRRLKSRTKTETLIGLYSATCAEITRYRDREWYNQGIFTAAIVTILGFILLHKDVARAESYLFDAALVLLAIGNIWFTLYVHRALAEQRVILARLREKLGVNYIFPAKWEKSSSFWCSWRRGVFSHLIWFFLADLWLVYEGIRLIHDL